MELPEPDLTASASLLVQQQFYHVSVHKNHFFQTFDSIHI
jgi:hypothetical protein